MGDNESGQTASNAVAATRSHQKPDLFRIVGHDEVAVTADEIRQLIDGGDLGPTTEVRRDAGGGSFALGGSPLFRDRFRAARPASPGEAAIASPNAGTPAQQQPAGQSVAAAPDGQTPSEATRKCPHCGTINPPSALTCVCGHGFVPGSVGSEAAAKMQTDQAVAEMKAAQQQKSGGGPAAGFVWLVIGVGLLIWSHSGADTHLIIVGTDHMVPGGISFGWAAIALGIWKFIKSAF